MSSTTWTPAGLSSEAFRIQCKVWRMVEAQHVVSTMKIVDSLAEQELLEEIIEQGKPPVPASATGLHNLLSTPFRYRPILSVGSRFRTPLDPGVFYGAERVNTAAAETGYRRWRFLQDSAGLERLPPAQFTAFSVPLAGAMVDLRKTPFDRDEDRWRDPLDYGATQSFAIAARQAALDGILYRSVRDPQPHWCIALLTPKAFASKHPDRSMQTWTLTLLPEEAVWQSQGAQSFAFRTSVWGVR